MPQRVFKGTLRPLSLPDVLRHLEVEACRGALRNTIASLNRRANLTRPDAYGLASMAVNFRITQVVDVNQGVHAMIPKDIFARELRDSIKIA